MHPDYLHCPNPPVEVTNHRTTMIHSGGSRHINAVQEDVTDRFPLIHTTRNGSSTARTARKLFRKMAMLRLTRTFPRTLTVNRLPQKTVTKQKTPNAEIQIERHRRKNESTKIRGPSRACRSQRQGMAKSWRVDRARRRGARLVSAGWELSRQSLTQSRPRQASPSCPGIRCVARVWQVRSRKIRDQRKCIVLKRASRERRARVRAILTVYSFHRFLLVLCIHTLHSSTSLVPPL